MFSVYFLSLQVNRPHPSDHPLLFLFLVGGVMPSELRLIREVVSSHKSGTQVGVTPFFIILYLLQYRSKIGGQ